MSGILPDIVQQVADLLLCLDCWRQLLLLLGHQGGGSFGPQSKEEQEEDSICLEEECQKKSQVSEEKTRSFNC